MLAVFVLFLFPLFPLSVSMLAVFVLFLSTPQHVVPSLGSLVRIVRFDAGWTLASRDASSSWDNKIVYPDTIYTQVAQPLAVLSTRKKVKE